MLHELTTTNQVIDPAAFDAVCTEGAAFWSDRSFVNFRRLMRGPDLVWGWWVERLALELEGFYERMKRGERPKLAIMAPPQHGKSWTATDFIAWVAARAPPFRQLV